MRSWCAKGRSWADAVLGSGDENLGLQSSPSLPIEHVIELTKTWRSLQVGAQNRSGLACAYLDLVQRKPDSHWRLMVMQFLLYELLRATRQMRCRDGRLEINCLWRIRSTFIVNE